nr:reverse transcriptase domain-containing protein [Tanacetum cinerariifolium]
MSTRSSTRNLFLPLDNPELTIRRRPRVDPTLLNDFEMATDENGDPPVPDLRTKEELCQSTLNGRGEPIAPIAIQATIFRLKNDMIQQIPNSCQFYGLSGDDANKHLDKFLHVTQRIKVNGVTDDAIRLSESSSSITSSSDLEIVALEAEMAKINKNLMKVLQINQQNVYAAGAYNQGGNTITNPKEDLKGITTRSGNAYKGPTIPTTSSRPSGILHDQKLRDKANDQKQKNFKIFKDLDFNISFADALFLMPKFGPTIKSLLTNKENMFELARTPLNKHCLAILLKKLSKKLGDPGKFLIPCDFQRMDECLALSDPGTSINLMPLLVWNKLSLPELSPTCMTLELVDRSISRPVGVAIDVFVKLGTFHFSTDFVVVDFDADPRVPLILERSFLKTGRSLIDVYEGELTIRVGKEAVAFSLDQTSRYSANYDAMPVNRIDLINVACENDFLFEETDAFLAIDDEPILLEIDESYYDSEGYILLLEEFLNDDPSSPPLPPQKLKGDDKLPVIIAKDLKDEEKTALIKVLKSHKQALAWKLLSDIMGINLEFCTHKILIEDDFKPAVQYQRRVNPKIHEVIKKEVLKLLDAELIFPISDSPWVDKAKVNVIAKLPHPTTVKGIRSFLGHASFYRRFIQDFSKIAQPMTRLLEKDTSFFFSKDCIEAFHILKRKLTEAAILVALDWDLPFDLMCDASDFAIAILVALDWDLPFDLMCDASDFAIDSNTTLERAYQRWLSWISKPSPRTNEFEDWVKLSDPKQALRGRKPMLILVVVMNKCCCVEASLFHLSCFVVLLYVQEFPNFEDSCSWICPSIT